MLVTMLVMVIMGVFVVMLMVVMAVVMVMPMMSAQVRVGVTPPTMRMGVSTRFALGNTDSASQQNQTEYEEEETGEQTESGGDPVLVRRTDRLVLRFLDQIEEKQPEKKDAEGVGKGDHRTEGDRISHPSLGTDQICGDHRFTVTRSKCVPGTEENREQKGEEDLPEATLSPCDLSDDFADFFFFSRLGTLEW